MREISFRGKRVDNNEWVYGYLAKRLLPEVWAKLPNNYVIIVPQEVHDDCDGKNWVFTETVGQFTGLYDKNGKEIYEGDIIGFYNDMDNLKLAGVVKFGDGAFYINCGWDGGYRLMDYDVEIIGNIHDNPDLMKCEI